MEESHKEEIKQKPVKNDRSLATKTSAFAVILDYLEQRERIKLR